MSAVPEAEAIQASFDQQLSQFVQKEIGPRADLLQAQMVDTESRSHYGNRLGILYARYGLYEEARQEFLKVLEIGEEGFVLLNLGDVAFITGANEDALDLYRRAPALAGEDPAAQLALIHVFHELDDSESVEILLHELGWMAPDLVDQFNLFVADHNDQGRSSGRGDRAGIVSWQAQQMSP